MQQAATQPLCVAGREQDAMWRLQRRLMVLEVHRKLRMVAISALTWTCVWKQASGACDVLCIPTPPSRGCDVLLAFLKWLA